MPVLLDQRLTKSTTWSRVSWGTQAPFRAPQAILFGTVVAMGILSQLRCL
jgi:hypothetical protein